MGYIHSINFLIYFLSNFIIYYLLHMSKDLKYGEFRIRFVAEIIDAIIINFVGGILSGIGMLSGGGLVSVLVFTILLPLICAILYYAYFESSTKQATLGKMVMKLKVVGKDGERISFANAIGRFFAKILSFVTLCVGYIMIAFDSKKQGFHDKLASTYVVKAD